MSSFRERETTRSKSMRKSASTGFALAWKASIAFSPAAIKIVSRAVSWLSVRASIHADYPRGPRHEQTSF
jgi:hypothetical protein